MKRKYRYLFLIYNINISYNSHILKIILILRKYISSQFSSHLKDVKYVHFNANNNVN